jgi:hypothetical protein
MVPVILSGQYCRMVPQSSFSQYWQAWFGPLASVMAWTGFSGFWQGKTH